MKQRDGQYLRKHFFKNFVIYCVTYINFLGINIMKSISLKSIIVFFLFILFLGCNKEEVDPFEKDSGVFTDSRDELDYNWVRIGERIWMAENLAYDAGNLSWPYDDDETNVNNMGRLYTWMTALTVCPAGWHLPTDQEWELLATYISVLEGPYNKGGDDWLDLGNHLKATSGWKVGNGTDDFGFAGLPGGLRYDNKFGYIGEFGGWWSATERSSTNAWVRGMTSTEPDFYRYDYPKEHGFSIRCVKD